MNCFNKTLLVLLTLCLVIQPVSATCLTSEQEQTLQQLANSSNVSYTSLVSIFENICTELEGKQTRTEADLQYQLTKDYIDDKVEEGENYYYVRVSQLNGHMVWSSPIWVKKIT